MSGIRVIYHGAPPAFAATDQHPKARRHGPYAIDGETVYVDAIGDDVPTTEAVAAMLAARRVPPAQFAAALDRHADRVAAWTDIAAAINQRKEKGMSLTGCSEVASVLREDLKRHKARLVDGFTRMAKVHERLTEAAGKVEAIAKASEAEVAELEQEIAQLTNFSSDLASSGGGSTGSV